MNAENPIEEIWRIRDELSAEYNYDGTALEVPAERRRVALENRVGIWSSPAVIALNNFVYKSLSNWAFNIAVGCSHACRFCYVPSAAARQTRIRSFATRVHRDNASLCSMLALLSAAPWN